MLSLCVWRVLCVDIAERFQLSLLLFVITIQNLSHFEWTITTEWALMWTLTISTPMFSLTWSWNWVGLGWVGLPPRLALFASTIRRCMCVCVCSKRLFDSLLPLRCMHPCVCARVGGVFLSEVAVDWMKHAFVAKYNGIEAQTYERFRNIICGDVTAFSKTNVRGEWLGIVVARGEPGRDTILVALSGDMHLCMCAH